MVDIASSRGERRVDGDDAGQEPPRQRRRLDLPQVRMLNDRRHDHGNKGLAFWLHSTTPPPRHWRARGNLRGASFSKHDLSNNRCREEKRNEQNALSRRALCLKLHILPCVATPILASRAVGDEETVRIRCGTG